MRLESHRTLTDDCCMANNSAAPSRRAGPSQARSFRFDVFPPATAASSPKTARSWGAPRAGRLGMIAKLLLQNLIWVVGMGALLFVPAGTLHWPAAWVFLGTIGISGIAGGLWLARTDPALLAERMHPMMQNDQPAADKKFMVVFGFAALIWFVAIGLDARYHASNVPLALQAVGLAMLLFSSGF